MSFAHSVTNSRATLLRIGIGALIISLLASVLSLVRADVAQAGSPLNPGPGWKDHNYGQAGNASRPSEDKPQSKVWSTSDGNWWGALFDDTATDPGFRIYQLSSNRIDWNPVGPLVDDRDHSQGDYLYDPSVQELYVASVDDSGNVRIYRFSYSGGNFSKDASFPVELANSGPSESVSIAKDTTGRLWVTYTNPNAGDSTKRDIIVRASSASNHGSWGSEIVISGSTPAGGDSGNPPPAPDGDISAIIAYGPGAIGVMWSNQLTHTFYFAGHGDGFAEGAGWSTHPVASGSLTQYGSFADDHINLKLDPNNPARVLAVVKLNLSNDNGRIEVLAGTPGSSTIWSRHIVIAGGISATRPQLVTDDTNDSAYVLYTWDDPCGPSPTPGCGAEDGGSIYYKVAPLGNLNAFGAGPGFAFIESSADLFINDVSTTKQAVTSATGLVAIATDPFTDGMAGSKDYFHGFRVLTGPPPPPPAPTACSDLVDNDGDGLVDLYDPGCSSSADNDEFNAPPPPPPGGHPFTDISGHLFEQDIIWLYNAGITAGCTSNRFCPDNVVNREQMASFLVRALGLPPTSLDFFTDDESSIHESDINRLAAAGVAAGCGGGRYCPLQVVNREQMASFLVRGYGFGPTGTDFFTDDESSIHESDINRLAASGTTAGCTSTRYCPLDPVTRGQMAAFIHRAET